MAAASTTGAPAISFSFMVVPSSIATLRQAFREALEPY
jgi:hypothetical protein